jgi:hypothetical protein
MARASESDSGSAGRAVELRDWAEQLPDVADAVRNEFGADAANRFSAELFDFQRRRCFVYAAVMALFIAPFFCLRPLGRPRRGAGPRLAA